jgi:hypothetical protein
MVNPCELDTTVWNVWRVGREIRADWLVIQRWRTESNVFANTIRCLRSISIPESIQYDITYSIPEPYLKDGPIFLCQLSCYFGMVASKLQKVTEEGNSRNLRKVLDFGCVCAIHVSEDSVDDGKQEQACDLVSHEGQLVDLQARSLPENIKHDLGETQR